MLPIGYWKGSSFSFMLDLVATLLTDGIGASDLDHVGKGSCGGASQVMILIDPKRTVDEKRMGEEIEKAIVHLKSAALSEHSTGIMAPGDDYIKARKDHDEKGIFVEDVIWNEILNL